MTTSRLALLLAVILAGMSTVFLLPKHLAFQPVGVNLRLPEYAGEWIGAPMDVTEEEKIVLGKETEFSRMRYSNGRGDELVASIVLAGQDMNTSIHRPERCLPAQGWTIADKHAAVIPIPPRGVIHATRLHALRAVGMEGDKPLTLYNLNYYWFVGHTDVTDSHMERTLIDIKDRLLRGYNQRWAYLTISGDITKDYKRFGRDEAEVDELIRGFIAKLAPQVLKETVVAQ